jgi:lipopolysaccharide/colanic/teichoic acid biosynthesis glycosyltransferase
MEACPAGGAVVRRDRWKRPFDLLVGAAATLAFLPVIALLAVLIRLDSRGPVFFRQERIGIDGARFRIWKFRSMYHDNADAAHRAAAAAWFAAQPTNGHYKSLDDPRITRVGRFIRRTNLDELPQLFNVLSGDMSLVGPRPAIGYELEHYLPWYFERQRVKPGMTGLWQISRRETVSAQDMMALDVRYVRERSLRLDCMILVRTVPALVGRQAELA